MDFQKALDLINKSTNVLITTHTRPDGDACGSIVAINDALVALGKKAAPLLLSPLPDWYSFLFSQAPAVFNRDVTLDQLKQGTFDSHDLIILIDVNSEAQLPGFCEYLKQNHKPVLVIDHHVTSDGLGDVELVDSSAAAAGLIVYELFKFARWEITEQIARALFVAIATDTGWFRFTNTDSRLCRAAAELIDSGSKPSRIYHQLYQNYSHTRFKLMTEMLTTLQLHLDDRYAEQYLTAEHFRKTSATHTDTENLIDECQRISSVEVASLFVELDDGRIKCSLRSRGSVDVREIAQKFAGGGHTMAAGLHLPGPLESAKQTIKNEIQKQLK